MFFKKDFYAVIAAGGIGTRLGLNIPKQFALVNEKPVLFYSLLAFSKAKCKPNIIVALSDSYKDYWLELCNKYNINIKHTIVSAGETRSLTINNAINKINNTNSIVAIHDGARPLISVNLINQLYECACKYGNAVPVIAPVDAIARTSGIKTHDLRKENFYMVQTPQCFITKDIKGAYNKINSIASNYDDDASLMEACAETTINKIEGERTNIKLTYNYDLFTVSTLLKCLENKT